MQINGKEIRFSISNKNHAANFEKAIRAMEKAMRKELESLLAAFSDGAIMEEREDAAP